MRRAGFTLIEAIVSFGVLAVVALATLMALSGGLKVTMGNRARAEALALGNTRIEQIRNLNYDDVATGVNYPPGKIPYQETITGKSERFTVTTVIIYVDDPYDGLATDQNNPDLNPNDYKKVDVRVSWPGATNPVSVTTTVAPKGPEAQSDNGTIALTAINFTGAPVQGASVHVERTNPLINIITETDQNGYVVIPLLPPGTQAYHITVTKAGYSSAGTYSVTADNPNPSPSDLTINAKTVINVSYAIDLTGTIGVNLFNQQGQPQINILLEIHGAKTIGTDNNNQPVYKYKQTVSSDTAGLINLPPLEADAYVFNLKTPGTYLLATSPIQPAVLNPSGALQVAITTGTSATNPTITGLNPLLATNTDNNFAVTVIGSNFSAQTTAKLEKSGQNPIDGTVAFGDGQNITITFNLVGAATGQWNLTLTNPNNEYVTQTNALTITTP